MKSVVVLACLLLLLPTLAVASIFDLTKVGKNGTTLITTTCNIQTTLEFQFSPSSKLYLNQTLVNTSSFRLAEVVPLSLSSLLVATMLFFL